MSRTAQLQIIDSIAYIVLADNSYTEEEMSALCVACAGYFDRAIKPPRVILHGPGGTERLRGWWGPTGLGSGGGTWQYFLFNL